MAAEGHYDKRIVVKESLEVLITAMIMLIVYSIFVHWKRSSKTFIPGPRFQWPLLATGYSRRSFYEHLSQISNTYGSIFMLRVLGRKVIVVSDSQIVREITSRPYDFEYSPQRLPGKMTLSGGKIIHCDYNIPCLKQHWRLCEAGINDFLVSGKGTSVLDREIKEILHEFNCRNNNPFDPDEYIRRGIINVIFVAVFGERFINTNDPEYMNISLLITALNELDENLEILELISEKEFKDTLLEDLGEKFDSLFETYKRRLKRYGDILDTQKEQTKNIAESLVGARERTKTKRPLISLELSDSYLLSAIHNIVTDELANTVSTIRWCLFYLGQYKEYQLVVQQEIDRVTSTRGDVSALEGYKFPFLQAVILETLRLANVKPLGLPHMAIKDTTLKGYDISQGTLVVTNLSALRRSPAIFSEPEKFNPYRFLDSHGKMIPACEELVFPETEQHSAEKKLAEIEIFYFVASILKEFSIELAENVKLQSNQRFTTSLQPFNIVARKRRFSDQSKFELEKCCYFHVAILSQTMVADHN